MTFFWAGNEGFSSWVGDYWPMATDLQCLMLDEPLSLQGNHLPVPSARSFWAREVSEEQKTRAHAKGEWCEKGVPAPGLALRGTVMIVLAGDKPEHKSWRDSSACVSSWNPSTAAAPTKNSVTFKAGSSPSFFQMPFLHSWTQLSLNVAPY